MEATMDPLVFLSDHEAKTYYLKGLRRRVFSRWKRSLSKYHLQPCQDDRLVSASFTWMRTSFSTELICDKLPDHLFPFSAAIEKDGNASLYFISRLRDYMIDKLEIPVLNLPLLVHAVAMFDARQLTLCFREWQDYYYRCKYLDRFSTRHVFKRSIRRWVRKVNKTVFLRSRFVVLQRRNNKRISKSTFNVWCNIVHAIRYRSKIIVPRNTRAALMKIMRFRLESQYQRMTLRNGVRFHLSKTVMQAYRMWISRLSKLSSAEVRLETRHLFAWLLQVVQRNWIESQELRDMYISAFGSRSKFFRCHRFISRLALIHAQSHAPYGRTEQNDAVDRLVQQATEILETPNSPRSPHSQRSKPVAAAYPSKEYFHYATPSKTAAAALHVSFDILPHFEDINRTLHSSALDVTWFSPDDEGVSRLVDSPSDDGLSLLHPSRLATAVPVASTGSTSPAYRHYSQRGTASPQSPVSPGNVMRGQNYVSSSSSAAVLRLIKQNPSSRLSQGWMLLSAAKYNHYRTISTALHRWMHRVPQIKLDSPHTFAIFFPLISQQPVLHTLIMKCADMRHRPAYYFVVYKQLKYALNKWIKRARRRIFLRTRSRYLKCSNLALRQTHAFGAWLVTTARHQQLRRTANRIICNRFKSELWRSWFAWRHQLERAVLIRTNNIEILRLRNQEIQKFTAAQGEKRTHRVQVSALREWSYAVQGRKHARTLCGAWHGTTGRRAMYAALQKWRLFVSYGTIANCIQKLWRGYRVRRLYNAKLYQHLKRFRANATKYLQCRRLACKRKIFAILKLFCRTVREQNQNKMRSHYKRNSLHILRRFALRHRMSHRQNNKAVSHRLTFRKRAVFTTIRSALRQHFLLQQITRLYVLKRTSQALRRWRYRGRTLLKQKKADLRCRKYLLRRAWKWLRKRCRQALRIRRWQTHRLRINAKRILRLWRRIITHRAYSQLRTFEQYKRRRFRTWFRWWRYQATRAAKHRQISVDQRAVFFLRQRGGRHFQVVRGIISARVRWYLKKFIQFTSFRRRERALMGFLHKQWRKKKLEEAVLHLYKESQRSTRQRRTTKSTTLGFDSLLARRYQRDFGASGAASGTGFNTTLGRRLPSTSAMLSGVAARQRSRTSTGSRSDENSYSRRVREATAGRNTPHARTSTSSTTNRSSTAYADASGRFTRRPALVGYRVAVSRRAPLSRDEILKKLHENTTNSPEYNSAKRGFATWLQFTRYNTRNRRALGRLEEHYWSVSIREALKKLYITLIHRRQRRARARRILTALQISNMKKFIRILSQRARRRRRQHFQLYSYQTRWNLKFKKFFFRRMYTICYFNRFALKLKCIKRLRLGVKAAFKKLRYIAWHLLRSPGATAIKKLDLKRKAIAYRKLRGLILKGKMRRALGRVSDAQCDTMRKLFLLRFWRKFVKLRRQLTRIVRRITFVPIMKMWYLTAMELQHADRSIRVVQKRVTKNTKMTIFLAWKKFSQNAARLGRAAEEVRRCALLNAKTAALYTWLRRIDQKINTDKALEVQRLSMTYLLRRCVFHWHKHALISELCTWKSTKAAVRNWHISTYISQRLRLSYMRAEAFHDAYLAQVYLYLWYKRIARRLLLLRRRQKALRLKNLRNYLVSFRKWKRRMYLVYRERLFLSPLQRDSRLFNMKRSLKKWIRAVRVKVHHGRRRTLRGHLLAWQSYTYKQRFARIAFLDRLSQFRTRELMARPFHAMIYNCKSLRMQKLLHAYTNMTTKSKVWGFWYKMSLLRARERRAMRQIIAALYRGNLHSYFRTWRVRTTVFTPLLQQCAVSQVWRKWKLALVARRQWQYSLLSKVINAWRSYFHTVDMNKVILLRKRRPMWRILIKKIRDDLLKMAVAFMRWKTCDASILVCDYRRYPQWANHTVAHDFYTNFPMQHLNLELGASHAGRFLTTDMSVTQHAVSKRRPALRLMAIQKHLERRFHGDVDAARGAPLPSRGTFYSPSKSPVGRSRSASPTTRGARTPSRTPSRTPGEEGSGRKYALVGSQGLERYKQSLFSPGTTGLLPSDISPVLSRTRSPSPTHHAGHAGAHSPGIALRAFTSPAAVTPYTTEARRRARAPLTGEQSILFSRGKDMKVNELM